MSHKYENNNYVQNNDTLQFYRVLQVFKHGTVYFKELSV